MNIMLNYSTEDLPERTISIRCKGAESGAKVVFSLYEQDNIICKKEANGDEQARFTVPFPSWYKISAEISQGDDACCLLWTNPIDIPDFRERQCEKTLDIKSLKGNLDIFPGEDNYIEVKFYDGGIIQIFEERSYKIPLFYRYRRHLDFIPCFDKNQIDKKCCLLPIYNELRNFYRLKINLDNYQLLALAQELESLDYVEYCCLLSKNKYPPPPDNIEHQCYEPQAPFIGQTPDFTPLQRYLDPGLGMNVRNAWSRGAFGVGATVRYMGFGVYQEHEDLIGNITVNSNRPGARNHGSAGVGAVRGINNGFGITGIAYGCKLIFHDTGIENLDRILVELSAGDLIIINNQFNINGFLLPMVHLASWWDRIDLCTRAGAVVVFAAGNGGLNLRQFPQFNNFGDSGGIMICSADSHSGLIRHSSNFNLYSMLNSWGDSVVTIGWGDLQNFDPPNRTYTATFSATSSATPLVCGALTVVQGYAIRRLYRPLNAAEMFRIVTLTGGREGEGQGIGVRPNVTAALELVDEMAGGGTPPPEPEYPPWRVGVQYEVGDRVSHLGLNYVCRSRHVSNIGWQPQLAVTLWTRIP
ncbi:S8 family serine peptidase [Sodalis sp. RH23]|uniref:S8 family serine peptidase n=1 Tax=unclassified Sodalis (in: enterobacteria) TaxID=2636512 RepID=UPI0039B4FFB2